MSSLDTDTVDAVVCQMLDAMRNAHIQMVVGSPQGAMDCIAEAAIAHSRLDMLFQGNPQNEALAGRILHEVIGQRMAALHDLAVDSLAAPLRTADVIALVTKPLNRRHDAG